MKRRVVIVGGGLSGLRAASALEDRGIHDYVLCEARERFGGRLLSATSESHDAGRDAVDLGATWFWPAMQPVLHETFAALGLRSFAQHEDGDGLVERSVTGPPVRVAGYASAPSSLRLAGGMASVIDALGRRLGPDRLRLGCTINQIALRADAAIVSGRDAAGAPVTFEAQHVLLAVPPRLAAHAIAFSPALPEAVHRRWQMTPTWMAPHAKYVAVYDEPFWRAQGLSGEARSFVGPLGEIHDASGVGDAGALFGFLGVPAGTRARVPESQLRELCRSQLARIFGPRALTPRADFIKDWAADPCTATPADLQGDGQHPHAPRPDIPGGPWQGRLFGVASEWSPEFSGYVAGAIDAADRGITLLSDQLAQDAP